jgi:hypothetical protein
MDYTWQLNPLWIMSYYPQNNYILLIYSLGAQK